MDDLELLRRMRSDVPPPSAHAFRTAEQRLAQAGTTRWRSPLSRAAGGWIFSGARLRLVGAGALAIALAAAAVIIIGNGPAAPPANAAVTTLRLASAAAARAATTPGPGQFVRTEIREASQIGGGWIAWSAITQWAPADAGTSGVRLTIALPPTPLRGHLPSPPEGKPAGSRQWLIQDACRAFLVNPSYAYLKTLPTDTARLRAFLGRDLAGVGGPPNELVFMNISRLLLVPGLPATLEKALYQVAATLPGLTYLARTADALGRSGVGVALTYGGSVDELIFSRATHLLLGYTERVGTALTWGPKGSLIFADTLLSKSVTGTEPHPAHAGRQRCP